MKTLHGGNIGSDELRALAFDSTRIDGDLGCRSSLQAVTELSLPVLKEVAIGARNVRTRESAVSRIMAMEGAAAIDSLYELVVHPAKFSSQPYGTSETNIFVFAKLREIGSEEAASKLLDIAAGHGDLDHHQRATAMREATPLLNHTHFETVRTIGVEGFGALQAEAFRDLLFIDRERARSILHEIAKNDAFKSLDGSDGGVEFPRAVAILEVLRDNGYEELHDELRASGKFRTDWSVGARL